MMELIEWYFLSGALSVWEMDVNNSVQDLHDVLALRLVR